MKKVSPIGFERVRGKAPEAITTLYFSATTGGTKEKLTSFVAARQGRSALEHLTGHCCTIGGGPLDVVRD
jgi:hypothetical protein